MKSFEEFFYEKSVPALIEQIATKAVHLNISEQELAQNIVSHFAKQNDDKSQTFVALMENLGTGATIGQGIGSFIGGGLGGLAKGFSQGWKSNFVPPVAGPANAKGQSQQTPQNQAAAQEQPVNAEAVPLNQQQAAAIKGQIQSLQNIQNVMQQAGLTNYSNYLAKLNQALTTQLQQAQQNLAAEPAQSNNRQQYFGF